MKLSPKALGFTFGSLWGISLFFCTLVAAYTDYMAAMLEMLVGVYPWYTVSLSGAFIGLGLGFLDGLIGGVIVGWVYNQFLEMFMSVRPTTVSATPAVKRAAPRLAVKKTAAKSRKK